MPQLTIHLVTRDSDGSIRVREYDGVDELLKSHEQVGIDDCSTDLSLRGLPVFRGLVGPIPDGKGIARYEAPEVFETLTKDWAKAKVKRRRRRSTPAIVPADMTTTTTIDTMTIDTMTTV